MNPLAMMKAMNTFNSNHPKFAAFCKNVLGTGVTEGTVIEITVQKPGEQPVTSNICVKQSDLDLLAQLKEMRP